MISNSLKLANIRLGFATNSSSSHSIVIVPKGESMCGEVDPDWECFGWENFVLVSPELKMRYLAFQVADWIVSNLGEEYAAPIVKEWFGVELPESEYSFYGIDHQSNISFPRRLKDGRLNIEFIREFEQFLMNDRVVVLGGNDNGDSPDNTYKNMLPLPEMGGNLYARKISSDWWSVFNPDTGAKIRLSFKEFPEPVIRANMPELVDLKITDYCSKNCSFCYQDSTTKGIHASLGEISSYLWKLSGLVFEVALGGGEPTLHPDFPLIIQRCRHYNIVPNFTTKLMPNEWSAEVLQAVQENKTNFAVSVTSPEEIYSLKGFNKIYKVRGNAHFVVGAHPKYMLQAVIDAAQQAGISLTLLGFKNIGRGADFKIKPQDISPQLFEHAWRISVDTSFLEQYADELKDIPKELKVSGEGTFSMYIDAVTQQAGISSYHIDTMVPCKAEDVEYVWSILEGK